MTNFVAVELPDGVEHRIAGVALKNHAIDNLSGGADVHCDLLGAVRSWGGGAWPVAED